MILYRKDDFITYNDGIDLFSDNNLKIALDDVGNNVVKLSIHRNKGHDYQDILTRRFPAIEITDINGVPYGETSKDVLFGFNKGFDSYPLDRTEDLVIVKFNNVTDRTTLSSAGSINDKTITLTSATGTTAGKYVILFDPDSERFSTFNQVGAAVGNVITLDSRLDFDYPAGTFVDLSNTNLAVDGSVTPVTYGLRGTDSPPGIDITFMLTRMIFTSLTTSPGSLSEFADIPALTNGIFFRSRNDRYKNITNVKTNGDLANIMYDWTPFAAINPNQGQDGFLSRLTLTRIGGAMELPIGNDAEWIIQDLLTDITLYEIVAEGYIKKKT